MTQDYRFASEQEKQVYEELLKLATKGEKTFLYKQDAVIFFEKSGLPVAILNQILSAVDTENKGYINQNEFFKAVKYIACVQNEIQLTNPIDMIQVPLPQFRDLSNEISPITEAEREKYIKVFESCNPTNGVIDSEFAMAVFMRSNLPVDKLDLIWGLADTRKSGTLNKTEFIIAMHYISRLLADTTLILPTSLPSQTYLEATGRFSSSLHRHNTMASPMMRNRSASSSSSLISSSSPRMDIPVSIPSDEFERYKDYFEKLDTDKSGYLSGEVAAYFFNHSKLPESDLGQIWNLVDTRRLGKIDLHDFSVAMYLIGRRQNGDSMQELAYRASKLNQVHVQRIQSTKVEYKKKAELEQQLESIKKEVQIQWQFAEKYRRKKKELATENNQLEKEVFEAKDKLNTAKKLAEEAEKLLDIEQENRDLLLQDRGLTLSFHTSPQMSTRELAMPDLTRAPSDFSNSTGLMSPSTPALNPNSGKHYSSLSENKKPPHAPLSPVQSKVISKYGFDITAFEAPSKPLDDGMSDREELASLFGAPISSKKKTATFDDIFM